MFGWTICKNMNDPPRLVDVVAENLTPLFSGWFGSLALLSYWIPTPLGSTSGLPGG